MALLLPEPDDGGLPVLKPLELPELPELGLLELLEAGLPGGPEMPDPDPTPAVCRAEPGRTSVKAPVAAIPPTPAIAVSVRTIDRPRSLAATALATLLRFMAIPPKQLADSSGTADNRTVPPPA